MTIMEKPSNSTDQYLFDDEQHILENPVVRIILFLIYSVVFFFCFFGNLAVVLVLTLHWRMRGVTKFCLGNLAFANLCVGIFCVYQNLFTYLIQSWIFGNFLCKLYHFTNSLSHTASILILVVICVERYLVILHPFKCRRSLTMQRLRILMSMVWAVSAILCSPRLYYINTIRVSLPGPPAEMLQIGTGSGGGNENGHGQPEHEPAYEVICVAQQNLYNNHTADIIYFVLLFALPLLIISILYTKIALFLRNNDAISKAMHPNEAVREKRLYMNNPNLSESETTRSEPEQSLNERIGGGYSSRLRNPSLTTNFKPTATKSKKSRARFMLLPSTYFQVAQKFKINKRNKRKADPSIRLPAPPTPFFNKFTSVCNVTERKSSAGAGGEQYGIRFVNTLEKQESRSTGGNMTGMQPQLQLTYSNKFSNDDDTIQVEDTSPSPDTTTSGSNSKMIMFEEKRVRFKSRSRRILKENQYSSNSSGNNKKEQKMQLRTLMKSKSYQRWRWQEVRKSSKNNKRSHRNWRLLSIQSQNQESSIIERGRDQQQVITMTMNSFKNSNNIELMDDDDININMYQENREDPSMLSKASSLLYCCCECALPSQCFNGNHHLFTVQNFNRNNSNNEFIEQIQMNNVNLRQCISSPNSPTIIVESSSRTLVLTPHLESNKDNQSCSPISGATTSLTSSHASNGIGNNVMSSGPGSTTSSQRRVGGRRLNRIRTFHPRPRQAVVRMLIIIVATFALCNLPFHLRKLCQDYLPDYYFESDISDLMTPVTFLLMYANCAINPILYAFIFKSFRSSFKDLVTCRWRRTRYMK